MLTNPATDPAASPAVAPARPASDLGAIIVATWAQGIFAATLALAVLHVLPPESILLLIGAIIANAQQAASYFLGSSKGSKDKDVLLANSSPSPNPRT